MIVFESYELLPSKFSASDVRPFAIGPSALSPNLRYCSGASVGANALRAFSDSSRKPKLLIPFQSSMPGLVTMSMPKPPPS